MKLYQTIDGTLIGFYRERGGEVQALMYRDVYETRMVIKDVEQWVWFESTFVSKSLFLPGHYVDTMFERDGYYERRAVRIPARQVRRLVEVNGYYETRLVQEPGGYEQKMVWFDEYSVTRYREVPAHWETGSEYVPAHYETQNIWVPGYYVTRYYWREAHPARGLEAAWIPYDHWIEAGYKDQRVWVEGDYQDVPVWVLADTEEYQEIFPAGEKLTRVWVEGEWSLKVFWVDATWEYKTVTIPETWGSETIWIEPISEMRKVWIPDKYVDVSTGERGHYGWKTVQVRVVEEVWIGYEPVYEYVDESKVRLFEVLELLEGAAPGPDYEDVITLRNMANGEELKTTATYLGLATKIADNEFVVPP